MRIAFVGGGTGGHFYPLIAVAEVLTAAPERPELYYIGPEPFDAALLAEHGITYVSCPAGKLRRYFSLKNIADFFRAIGGLFVAIYKLYLIYPDVLFSKGSFTSVPVLAAAWFLRIPVVIHESDAVPGRANKFARGFARYIGISYDDAAAFFPKHKTALVGIPLRRAMLDPHPDPFQYLGIPNDLPLILVTGGSLGASRINTLILQSLGSILPEFRLFHLTGPVHLETTRLAAKTLITDPTLLSRYYLEGRVNADIMNALLSAATLVISRSGSTTLFEISLHGKPAILIPIPEDVSHDQRSNAYAYARSGAASVIEEHNLTEHLLLAEIASIIRNPDRYNDMSRAAAAFAPKDAAQKIAAVLISIGIEHGSQ